MSEQAENLSEFQQFVESVKAKIPIDWLYTKLTGQDFVRVDARPRAKCSWRIDNTPSLTFVPDKNILWDFTDKQENSDKNGKPYNVIDILRKCGGAVNYGHAVQMACELAKVEFPAKFQKNKKEFNNIPLNLGNKIIEVWEACKVNRDFFIKNPNKRPIAMNKFFENRNIPFEEDFLKGINIGILPKYDVIYEILKGHGILKIGKDDKELNIYRESMGDDAMVYPLYNLDGGLCGFRFRQLSQKEFAEWIPVNTPCFFNAQRFVNRPRSRRLMIVEGEMNLVAYARAVWNETQDRQKLEEALTIIYSTGSKTNSVKVFKEELDKVFYIQDYDLGEENERINPKNHPIINTCAKISKELEANDLIIADWGKLPYVQKKYDIEEYLKHHDYKLASILDIPRISLPRYAVNCIKTFVNTIEDEDNKRDAHIKLSFALAEKLQFSQRKIFEEIAKKEFNLTEESVEAISSINRDIKCADYSIDESGRIIQTLINDDNISIKPKTNFYLRIADEITYFNNNGLVDKKFYNVEIVINNSIIKNNEIPSCDMVDNKKLMEFTATTASLTDLIYYDPSMRDKNFWVIKSLMSTIPARTKTHIFPFIGRPCEEFCISYFKTDYFCLYPKVSIINGEIVKNKNFEVKISNTATEQSPYGFIILDDDQFRQAGMLFWNHLRKVHDTNLIDSLIGMIFDSCTRELQGFGIVQNEHGFPIYLAGQSGSYKTTAAIAAMSLIGDFKNQDNLLAWNGTAISLEHQLIKIGVSTAALDDLKIEEMKNKEFIDLFHSIYGGLSRTRMDPSATKIRGGNKLKCSLIVTSEGQATDIPESIAARMLVLRVVKCSHEIGKERKIHLDKMKELIDNQGFRNFDLMRGFTPRLIAWAQRRGIKYYAESILKWKTKFEGSIAEEANNAERPSDMIARIISAFEQIVEFCKEQGFCSQEEGNKAFESLVIYWQQKVKEQIARIEKQSSTYRVIDLLCQIIQSEAIGIRVYNGTRWLEPKRNFGGFPIRDITYPDGSRKIHVASPHGVLKVMNTLTTGTSIILDKFTQDLKESGIIETNLDGSNKAYPVPDENGKLNEKKLINGIFIDYETLMKAYSRIKSD
jgi:hypothetical protein